MSEAEFKNKLYEESIDFDEVESNLAFSIFVLEKELGCHINESYPVMKFLSQFDNMMKFRKLEEKEYSRIKSRGRFR